MLYDRGTNLSLGPAHYPERLQARFGDVKDVLTVWPVGKGETDAATLRHEQEAVINLYDIVPDAAQSLFDGAAIELLRNEKPDIYAAKVLAAQERIAGYVSPGYTPPIFLPVELVSCGLKFMRDAANPFSPVTFGRRKEVSRYIKIKEENTTVLRGLLDSFGDVPAGPVTRTADEWGEDIAGRLKDYIVRDREDVEGNKIWHDPIHDWSDEKLESRAGQAAEAAIRAMDARYGTARQLAGGVFHRLLILTEVESVGKASFTVTPLELICSAFRPDEDGQTRLYFYKEAQKDGIKPTLPAAIAVKASLNKQVMLELADRNLNAGDGNMAIYPGINVLDDGTVRIIEGENRRLVAHRVEAA